MRVKKIPEGDIYKLNLGSMSQEVKKAELLYSSIQVSSACSGVLNYIANVFQLVHRCCRVTAWEKETALLTKMCPGSIISALWDIKHNITLPVRYAVTVLKKKQKKQQCNKILLKSRAKKKNYTLCSSYCISSNLHFITSVLFGYCI